MLLKTALKNILGAGFRTWLNAFILAIVLVMMLMAYGLVDGWKDKALQDSVDWEYAHGQVWCPEYDPFDLLGLADAHAILPSCYEEAVERKEVAPVLMVPASIFPEGRMVNVQLRGMDPEQELTRIQTPAYVEGEEIPVVIGEGMAEMASLKKGDLIMTRWRDKNGTFDARSLVVSDIFDTDNANVDEGMLWMNLEQLRELTLMDKEATLLVCGEDFHPVENEGWQFHTVNDLLKDFLLLAESQKMENHVAFVLLLCLALIAIYDTQTLSIFKRRKEIGTYVALGMTPRRVVNLFVLEGVMYGVLSVLLAAILGAPFLYHLAKNGFDYPAESMSGAMMPDVIYPVFHTSTILMITIVAIVMAGLISWFPSRKIAKMNMVLALKGKVE